VYRVSANNVTLLLGSVTVCAPPHGRDCTMYRADRSFSISPALLHRSAQNTHVALLLRTR